MCTMSLQAELSLQVLRTACKKFAESAKVWLAHIRHLLVAGDGEASQNVLNRALAGLPRRKHIKVSPMPHPPYYATRKYYQSTSNAHANV